MLKRLSLAVAAGLIAIGQVSAQQFIADQVLPVRTGVTASVYQELGSNPCQFGIGWPSFFCGADKSNGGPLGEGGLLGSGTDAAGGFYQVRIRPTTPQEQLCPLGFGGHAYEIERSQGAVGEVIAQVPTLRTIGGVCGGVNICTAGQNPTQATRVINLDMDATNGYLYIALISNLRCGGQNQETGVGIVRLTGLPNLLDIIPTFQPAAGTLSWVTPKHPEALPAADRFMVFEGSIDAASGMSVPSVSQ